MLYRLQLELVVSAPSPVGATDALNELLRDSGPAFVVDWRLGGDAVPVVGVDPDEYVEGAAFLADLRDERTP
jgi:hypothetical protein